MHPIKVIDLFAGPGGLGEGFSSIKDKNGMPYFELAASVEMDPAAHKTLMFRSFFRSFNGDTPEEYYQFLRGELGSTPEDYLYNKKSFSTNVAKAKKEALNLTLGKDNPQIYSSIDEVIAGEECVLIGGPPCQAYSGVGKSRNAGKAGYRIEDDPKSRLYLEYLKVIATFQPVAFVMENVKGMLSAKLDGQKVSDLILNDLQRPSKVTGLKPVRGKKSHEYRIVSLVHPLSEDPSSDPKKFIIHSENYGVPQKRHRVILLGLREDFFERWDNKFLLGAEKDQIPLNMLIEDMPKLRSGLSRRASLKDSAKNWERSIKRVKSVVPAVKKMGYKEVAERMLDYSRNIKAHENGQGGNFGLSRSLGPISTLKISDWILDERMGNYVCNHEAKEHQESDLHRYLFCSAWAATAEIDRTLESPSPRSKHYPEVLKPDHKNFNSGKFADRFRVLTKYSPAKTIVSHLSKDGHAFIHYDPLQCRSLTVREAARVQSFPDNYFFVGAKTDQYIQVGNAVPPYLAKQIAESVARVITGE